MLCLPHASGCEGALLGSAPYMGTLCSAADQRMTSSMAPGTQAELSEELQLPLGGALLTQGLLGGLEVTLPPSCSFWGWFGAGF